MSSSHDILIVDDDERMRRLVGRLCKSMGLTAIEASNGEEAIEQLAVDSVPVMVLDLKMPVLDGFEVLEHLRNHPPQSALGVVVVTANDDAKGRTRATELGAIDFVSKPFRGADLQRRIERTLSIIDLERRLATAEADLQSMQSIDPVTGVGAAGKLYEVLEAEFHAAQVGERPLTCMVVSDEHYNETLAEAGREAGEARLQKLSQLIEARLRGADRVFRVDAAEFVVLLPGTTARGARQVVEKVFDTAAEIGDLGPEHLAVAVAAYPHPEIHRASLLYRAVNLTLAQARATGRVGFFEGF